MSGNKSDISYLKTSRAFDVLRSRILEGFRFRLITVIACVITSCQAGTRDSRSTSGKI